MSDVEKKSEDEQSMTTDSGKPEITAFDLAMDSVIRSVNKGHDLNKVNRKVVVALLYLITQRYVF